MLCPWQSAHGPHDQHRLFCECRLYSMGNLSCSYGRSSLSSKCLAKGIVERFHHLSQPSNPHTALQRNTQPSVRQMEAERQQQLCAYLLHGQLELCKRIGILHEGLYIVDKNVLEMLEKWCRGIHYILANRNFGFTCNFAKFWWWLRLLFLMEI